MGNRIYFGLDEAREEIEKRWTNLELRRKIETELGDKFISTFGSYPRGVTFRQLCSPDNGFTFFFQCSKYAGTEPLILEYLDDIFVHFNDEKKGLGRLRLTRENGEKNVVDIMSFHDNEKKKIKDCTLISGENLVNFHHNLFKFFGFNVDFLENSKWFHNIGKAEKYYYFLLLHFIAHGILFETFSDEDDSENKFTNEIIKPTIKKIEENTGFAPVIVRLYPSDQNIEEDFYWWSYPPFINKYLIEYSENKKLVFKTIK